MSPRCDEECAVSCDGHLKGMIITHRDMLMLLPNMSLLIFAVRLVTYCSPDCSSGSPGVNRSNLWLVVEIAQCADYLLILQQDDLEKARDDEWCGQNKTQTLEG